MQERLGPRSIWLAINIVGAAIFLALASQSWIEPELANMPGASGGQAIMWFFMAAPIAALFGIAHCFGGFVAFKNTIKKQRFDWLMMLAATAVLWGLALWLDNMHHGI